MSYIITINGQDISLEDIENPFVEIDWQEEFSVNFDRLTEYERKQIFLIGFPLEKNNYYLTYFRFLFGFALIKDKIKNFSNWELINSKYTINHNLGLCMVYKIIEQMKNYKYILILPHADGIGMHYLRTFIESLNERMNKVIQINIVNQPKIEFKFNDVESK